jgi:hypothetical protein
MDRTAAEHLAPADPTRSGSCHALAYDRRLGNRRPVFALQHDRVRRADGTWQATRTWRGVGPASLAVEQVLWRDGLVRVDAESPSIGERVEATVDGDACLARLSSHRTGGAPRERRIPLPHAPVTLAALPLLVAGHWHRLCAGQTVDASYLVLKVQRAATVRLTAGPVVDGRRTVVVTPRHPLLRALFGRTRCVCDADAPRLRRIDGLLDPRDLRPNGRWREYLGTIEFDAPVDLSGLVPRGAS